jgi:hypothetical protein
MDEQMLGRNTIRPLRAYEDDLVSVMLEPKPGSNDSDVLALLRQFEVEPPEVLAAGFIAARVPRQKLAELESVAFVHLKQMKQMRFGIRAR